MFPAFSYYGGEMLVVFTVPIFCEVTGIAWCPRARLELETGLVPLCPAGAGETQCTCSARGAERPSVVPNSHGSLLAV